MWRWILAFVIVWSLTLLAQRPLIDVKTQTNYAPNACTDMFTPGLGIILTSIPGTTKCTVAIDTTVVVIK